MKFVETTDAPRATPADIDRIYRQLWGKEIPMNGWTPSIPASEKLQNELAAVNAFLEDDPENPYWLNRRAVLSAQLFTAAELDADADWLDLRNTEASQG